MRGFPPMMAPSTPRGVRRGLVGSRVHRFMSGFDSVRITMASYIVRTLQEMVSSDPQIIVVAPGAKPAPMQVYRTDNRELLSRYSGWVPKACCLDALR